MQQTRGVEKCCSTWGLITSQYYDLKKSIIISFCHFNIFISILQLPPPRSSWLVRCEQDNTKTTIQISRGSAYDIDPIIFGCRSGQRDGSKILLSLSLNVQYEVVLLIIFWLKTFKTSLKSSTEYGGIKVFSDVYTMFSMLTS